VRKAKVEMLEGELNCFIMYDDKMPHEMFNRLNKLVNKARAIGFNKWTDRMLTERMMMAYTPMNYNIVALIRQDPTYKKMTSDDVLGRIVNHEMNIQEANNIKNLYKGVSTSKKQDIALKANKSKKKKVLIESPSEEEVHQEKKILQGGKGKRSQGQRGCATTTARMGTSLSNAHMRGRKKIMIRERSLTKATRKTRNMLRRSLTIKLMLAKNGTQVMRVLTQKVMKWQP
jgi:hypothetical protein